MNPNSEVGKIQYLTADEIISIHDKLIEKWPGEPGIFPEGKGKIESIVLRMKEGFYTKDPQFITIYEKVAFLFQSILQYHPFIDGMKRTGIMSSLAFLLKNDIIFYSKDSKESVAFAKRVAGEMSLMDDKEICFEEITNWFKKRTFSIFDKDRIYDFACEYYKVLQCPRCKGWSATIQKPFCRDCGLELIGIDVDFNGIVFNRTMRLVRQSTKNPYDLVYSKKKIEWKLIEKNKSSP